MKHFATLSGLALAAKVSCFPHLAMDSMTDAIRDEALSKRQSAPPQGAGALPLVPPAFDAEDQLIDVSGEHEFVAPGPGDQRGQCPGLNALANHGYLPHNGIATIDQFVEATTSVFGMGVDLATFLATYGAILDGDLTSWSIGGKPHTGIGGSHGNYETDSSPLKGDLYQYGDLSQLVISQYENLRDMQPDAENSNYNLEVLRQFRKERFQESIDKVSRSFFARTKLWGWSSADDDAEPQVLLPAFRRYGCLAGCVHVHLSFHGEPYGGSA